MTQLAPELERALAHVGTDMDPERTDQVWGGLVKKRRNRTVRRTAAAALVLVAGTLAYRANTSDAPRTAGSTPPEHAVQPPKHAVEPPAPTAIRLADGSTMVKEARATSYELVRDHARDVAVAVASGKLRFKVDAASARRFVVTTKNVRVSVYSAEFSVAHFNHKTVVEVYRGYVELEQPDAGKRRLGSGESAELGPPPTKTAQTGSDDANATEPPETKPVHKLRHHSPAQRRLAVSELLKKADHARAEGRPADAIAPLSRVVRRFTSDPRAAMAAFTIGRIYLADLNRPTAAARAFRRVETLTPRGPLAEDALAREVQSWAAAGHKDMARTRARRYLERYPNGHRVRAMKNYAE